MAFLGWHRYRLVSAYVLELQYQPLCLPNLVLLCVVGLVVVQVCMGFVLSQRLSRAPWIRNVHNQLGGSTWMTGIIATALGLFSKW